jgi:signal peptidase II
VRPSATSAFGDTPPSRTAPAHPGDTTTDRANALPTEDTGERAARELREGPGASPPWTTWLWTAWVILVALLATADQATKAVAQARLGGSPARTVVFIPGILSFTYRENPGGAFSLLAQSHWAWVLGPLALAATVAVIWWLLRCQVRSWLEASGGAFIVGGAVGNLIDRLALGAVRDFLKLTCIHWPVFNLADAFVCVGVGLLLLSIALGGASASAAERAAGSPRPPEGGHSGEERGQGKSPSPKGSGEKALPR